MYLFIASVYLTDHTKAELENAANIFKVQSLCRACMRLCLGVWLFGQANGIREPENLVGLVNADVDYSQCCPLRLRLAAACTSSFGRQVPRDRWWCEGVVPEDHH
jgi:hypothetical protein